MNFNDIEEFFPVGSKIRVISHGEIVDGTLIKLNAPSIILRRADNGRPKIIDCEKIETIDCAEDLPTTEESSAEPLVKSFQTDFQTKKEHLAIPLIYLTQPPSARFEHRDYIKSLLKEYRKSGHLLGFDSEWNQLDNTFENAKKNNCLATKREQIFRRLKELVNHFPSEPANIFAGDVYSACNDWPRAAASYAKAALYAEATACAVKITDTKNPLIEVLRRQLFDKAERNVEAMRMFFYYSAEVHCHRVVAELLEKIFDDLTDVEREIACQGCYKILVDSGNATLFKANEFDYSPYSLRQLIDILKQVGQNDQPFILPDFEDEQVNFPVNAALQKGRLTFFKQADRYGFIDGNIYFNLAQVEDKGLRQALHQFGLWRDNVKITYILAAGKTGAAADHIKLMEGEDLPSDTVTVHNGVLEFYDIGANFGKVIDTSSGRSYNFKFEAVLDACLRRYLQDAFIIREMHVQFTLKLHRNKEVVRRLRLTMNELVELSKEYGLAAPAMQPQLTDEMSDNLPPYQPLPPLREGKAPSSPPKEIAFQAPIPKKHTSLPGFVYRKGNAYEEGCRYLAKKNYAKAAACFEVSIFDENFLEKSLKGLLSIYKVSCGEDPNVQVEKGLQLLSKYEDRLDKNTVIVERIQLLDKGKRQDELIVELQKGIAVSYKINQRLHYRLQLAREYTLKKDYEAAIKCYETWLKEKKRNRDKLSLQMDVIERKVIRNMAVCLYFIGAKARAKEIAEEILKETPDDLTARSILDDELQETTKDAAELDLIPFADYDSEPMSSYVKYKLDQIILEKTYSTAYHRIFKGKFDAVFNGDDFIGTPEDVAKIRSDLKDSLKNSSDKERSEAWAFLSKLVMKVHGIFSDERERCEKNRIGSFWEHESIAQFMGYAGDYELQQQLDCNVDVARFFYNEEISMTPKGSDIDTRAYFIKLIASFFIEPNAVPQLKPSSRSHSEDKNAHLSYLWNDHSCSEPRRLLVSTFLIHDKMQDRISKFLEEMGKYPKWLSEAEKLFNQLLPEQVDKLTAENFKARWKKAKDVYCKNIEKFLRILHEAAQNYDNTSETGLNSFLEKIKNMLESSLLSKTDSERVKNYCKLLTTMSKIGDKSTFEEKENEYREIIEKSDYQIKDICEKPTKLSYETLREIIESLQIKAEEDLKKLYASSVPELKIETNIIGADPVQFIVTVENKENCQTAVNMKTDVESMGGEVEIKSLGKKSGTVRGGARSEFLYEAALGEQEKSQGYLEVMILVTYRYRVAIDDIAENSVKHTANISLLNSDDYEEIVNVYDSISETNGVPIGSNLFYGRNEDITKIVQMLKLQDGSLLKNRCLVMHGQKRAGKTSIMNHLKAKIREVYGEEAYVIVSVGSVGEVQSLYAFLSRIVSKLKNTLRKEHKALYDFLLKNGVTFPYDEIESNPSDDAKTGIFRRTLDEIIEKSHEFSGSEDKYIPLFLIDEFTYFYQWIKDGMISANFMKFWKAFLQNNPICAIVIGMDHMPQFIEEYENEFACAGEIPVHFLKKADTKDLANKPILLKDGTSRYKDKPGEDALSYIYRLTAGSAYLTVIFCNAFVKYLNERKTTYITRTVIDNFIREKLLGPHPVLEKKMFEPQLNDPGKFSEQEQEATYSDNKTVLTYIAVHADNLKRELSRDKINCINELSERTNERLDVIVNQLTRRRVLTKRGNEYKIEIELLHMWLRREIGEDF